MLGANRLEGMSMTKELIERLLKEATFYGGHMEIILRQAASALEAQAGRVSVTQDMVDRFLRWPLPETFAPDCWIVFNGRGVDAHGYTKTWPVGTNLLTAIEARAMLEYVLSTTPKPSYSEEDSIADHLFIDQRGDGIWLVCVEKVHKSMEAAQAACEKWKKLTAAPGAKEGT